MQTACVVLNFHLWPVWPYHAFTHYLIKGKIFWKKLFKIKCVLWFSLKFLSETFLILHIQRYSDKCTNVFKFLSQSKKTWNFLDKLSKNDNIFFHEKPCSDYRAFPCERTDMTKLAVTSRNFGLFGYRRCSTQCHKSDLLLTYFTHTQCRCYCRPSGARTQKENLRRRF